MINYCVSFVVLTPEGQRFGQVEVLSSPITGPDALTEIEDALMRQHTDRIRPVILFWRRWEGE